jgi:indolepyruvate ferredoxin oxidoreductase
LLDELMAGLRPENHAIAVEIASLPEEIRGYGHVKMRHLAAAKEREMRLLAEFRSPTHQRAAA